MKKNISCLEKYNWKLITLNILMSFLQNYILVKKKPTKNLLLINILFYYDIINYLKIKYNYSFKIY